MNKKNRDLILIGGGLVLLSLFLHYIHYLLFRDLHHTLIFLAADIAFIPMEVFFSYFVFDRLLEKREVEHIIERLHILIGVFFSEVGSSFLSELVNGDSKVKLLREKFCSKKIWNDSDFEKIKNDIITYDFNLNINSINVEKLKRELDENRDFIINLLMNESLHEHETFTEMLMSLMHLKEELDSRWNRDIANYEEIHIEMDMENAYKYLTIEWCQYMKYLSGNYPNLFIKALIDNPFDNRDKKEKDYIYMNINIEN